jgi:hypothetical protein
MNTILITSGFLQMILAVSLGWVMTGFYKTPDVVGPFKSSKRVLQAHIDNILMALLTLVSFAALTIAYPWLLISFLLSGNA